ncbi:MAG: helix-turn-helix transcriptional regulator [Clostridiales bacterium]|nr:helix-turn-helix transcriptional regulator [Clostridiales bacterium]
MKQNDYAGEEFETPIGVRIVNSLGNIQPNFHWHNKYELLFIIRGSYKIDSNTIQYENNEPAVFIHRPFCLHKLNADTDNVYQRYIVHISKRAIEQFAPLSAEIAKISDFTMLRVDPNPVELREISDLFYHINQSRSDTFQSALYSALTIHKILQIYDNGRGEGYITKHSYIQDVLQTITENLSESMTIADICKQFSVGHTKLLEDFKNATGSTYKKYLTTLRQTRARELLESGSSIVNASLEVGYSSEAHFIKAFRKYWGITPGEYLKSRIDIYSKT